MAGPTAGGAQSAAPAGAITIEEIPLIVEQGGVRGWLGAHPVISYLLRRFVLYVFTLWAAFTATFFFFRLIPGNPIGAYIESLQKEYLENASASAAVIAHYKKVFGLDGNLLQQYGSYMYQLIFKHNMGPSLLSYPTPALTLVAQAIPWTLGLLGLATIIAWLLGIVLGAFAGWRRESRISGFLTYCALATSNIPFFFLALILLLFLAFDLNWLPSSYPYGNGLKVGLHLPFILSLLKHAILPAVSLVIVSMFGNLLGMRTQMITVLGEDYLTFANAKGLRPWHILRRYGMPNCYLPQITGLMISFGFIFNGNIILENLFLYPGVGHLLVLAVGQLDLNTMMAVTDTSIFMVISAVFLIDMFLPLLDPRIKFSR
ncbi:MAG TPA: ABC transporter permease [Candidatus Dormibacteraeota bacterium]|jgi:peptide/nickel transport system permease protein|nr:ABC transporter permease [Candidatus Dormibacteraeota bacterium]